MRAVFEFPDGSREDVVAGGRRYRELINLGHTPLSGPVLPPQDPFPQYLTVSEAQALLPPPVDTAELATQVAASAELRAAFARKGSDGRGDLGLGGAATKDVGSGPGKVAAGDDPRITGAVQPAQAGAFVGGYLRSPVMAALGDSITACPVAGAGPTTKSPPTYLMPGWGYYNQAVHRSMGRVVGSPALNFGNGGDTITQVLARIPNVIAAAPGVCVVLAGPNDVGQGLSQSAVLANVDTLFASGHDALKAAGILPVVVTIPPRSTDTTLGYAAGMADIITAANVKIRRLARQRGYPLVDAYRLLVDPATGNYVPANTLDGVHPSSVGAKLMAAELLRVLGPYLPPTPQGGTYYGDATNLAPNQLYLGATTTVSGMVQPTGWTCSRTAATRSLVAGSAGDGLLGKWRQFNPSAAEAAANPAWQEVANYTSGFAVGDTLQFGVRVQAEGIEAGVAGSDGLKYLSTRIRFNGPNIFHEPMYRWTCDIGDALVVYEAVVPAGTTSIDLMMAMDGQGTARWGEWTVRKVA